MPALVMRIPAKVAAPSPTLLKFLKSQSEGVCFFTPNPRHGAFTFDHAAPRACQPRPKVQQSTISYSQASKRFCTVARRQQVLEAGFGNLDHFWSTATPHFSHGDGEQCWRSLKRPRKSLTARRHGSSWLPGMFGARKAAQEGGISGAESEVYDDDSSSLAFNRTIAATVAAEAKLRCTEFDENGNVVLVDGQFKKSELIQKYGLLPRDLRKIDSSLLPHILVRPSAILINLLHIRCLIKANRVLLFDAYGSSKTFNQSVFMYDLGGKLQQKQQSPLAGGLPYEFRALEAVLVSVTGGLESEFETVREPVVRVLRALEEDIDRDKLRHLLVYSKKLGTFAQRAKLVRDAIDEILEEDVDLVNMYLTEKTHDLLREGDDHTEIEMLLESYHKVCDEIYQASVDLVSNIRNTEEIVKAILDANRNSLMILELKFSVLTLSLSSAALIAAFYGMNLKNFLEESSIGFGGVCAFSAVFASLVCVYGFLRLRRVQRVSMWGEKGVSAGRGRGAFRDIDDVAGLVGAPLGKQALRERKVRWKVEQARLAKEHRQAVVEVHKKVPVPLKPAV